MTLTVVNTRTANIQAAMVTELEMLLEKAKAGTLQCIAYGYTESNGTFSHDCLGSDKLGALGAVTVLQAELTSSYAS